MCLLVSFDTFFLLFVFFYNVCYTCSCALSRFEVWLVFFLFSSLHVIISGGSIRIFFYIGNWSTKNENFLLFISNKKNQNLLFQITTMVYRWFSIISTIFFFIQNETKRIIVEFGAHRQQFIFTDRLISISTLLQLIGNRFDVQLENNSPYILQIYDRTSNEYHSLDDYKRVFDLEELHRFRIIRKSLQSQVDDH